MDPLLQMLQELLNGLDNGSGRFHIIDDVHIHDTQSGLKFHMYDLPEPFHITMFETGQEMAHMRDFQSNPTAMQLFGSIKDKLTTMYVGIAESKRNKIVELFNTPKT